MVNVLAQRAEGNVRPHVFYRDIPNLMLYVRDVPPSGDGWDGVFMSDTRPGQPEGAYLARHGHIAINRVKTHRGHRARRHHPADGRRRLAITTSRVPIS